MAHLSLEILTPERTVLESPRVEFVVFPALEGEMGILPGHLPLLAQLREGELRIHEGGEVRHFAVSGGFAQVSSDKISVFAETAEMAEEIDAEQARQALEKARARLVQKELDPLTLAQAEAAARRAAARLKVAELRQVKKKKTI